MRKIIHISDLHFGRINKKMVEAILAAFTDIKPDLVIISGDLTQRARPAQFKSAVAFLDNLKSSGFPYFVIPGNHDIEPFISPLARIRDPYRNYRKYISEDIQSFYKDKEIAVASLNTARPENIKNGKVRPTEVEKVHTWFSSFPPEIIKIVVSHHPLDLPIVKHRRKLARGAHAGLELLSTQNVDLYLSGHLHRSSAVTTEERYNMFGYHAVALSAGTVSERQRGEVASFNVIDIHKPKISLETYLFDSKDGIFAKGMVHNFEMSQNLWKKS
jgi:3',5'-cyclic AMP phosphodiesterase CpdA